MSEEKSEKVPVLDVYIRMNEDDEKDYCFQISADKTFGDLIDIFTTLPLNMAPNMFHERVPKSFRISTAPGFLTREGGLLFGEKADAKKFCKAVSNSDVVSTKVWPGQLILPVFEEKSFFKYSVIAFLLTWLYTDLPDFISPTPGICLTNWGTKAACWAIDYAGYPRLAKDIYDDMFSETSVVGQCVFFTFHIFKVGLIYLALYIGMANPYSFTSKPPEVERDDLVRIGWTGAKKSTSLNFKQYYREAKIKEVGGVLKAHQSGLLERLRVMGAELGPGEGYETPLTNKKTVINDEQHKFLLSPEYLSLQESFFHKLNADVDDQEFNLKYKELRTYGPLKTSEELSKIINARIDLGDGDADKNYAKKASAAESKVEVK